MHCMDYGERPCQSFKRVGAQKSVFHAQQKMMRKNDSTRLLSLEASSFSLCSD
jgi:uncharacterized protein YodC (DUF2158 family)